MRDREKYLAYQREYGRTRRPPRSEAGMVKFRAARQGRREQNQSAVAMLKLERGCTDCGYAEHPQALEFDHLGGKVSEVAKMVGKTTSLETILAEIDKCEVVCANCHRLRTARRRNVATA